MSEDRPFRAFRVEAETLDGERIDRVLHAASLSNALRLVEAHYGERIIRIKGIELP